MSRTILIVDDNDQFRGMLTTVLGLRGYTTVAARSAAEGLKAAAARAFDAVITDVEMPDMNGLEFCAELREQEKPSGRYVPVWIMTGGLRVGVNRRATALGALHVLRKPLNVDEVCAQFEHEFHRRETGSPLPAPDAAPETGGSGGSAESLGRL